MRIDGAQITVDGAYKDRTFTADQVIAALDGAAATARLTWPAAYSSTRGLLTVHFTALTRDGAVITSRTGTGITETRGATSGESLYLYDQPTGALTEFVAVWDEGDVNTYSMELIVVQS